MATQEITLSVPELVRRGLDRSHAAYQRAQGTRTRTHAAQARKLGRIAASYERESRWWNMLSDWTFVHGGADRYVYGDAVIAAELSAAERARTYRDLEAQAWRRSLAVASDSGVAA